MKASAGRGIKEPTLIQSFSRIAVLLGNPDLEPERSRTVDVGIEQRLSNDRVKLELTWFDNRYRNIISTRTISFNPVPLAVLQYRAEGGHVAWNSPARLLRRQSSARRLATH